MRTILVALLALSSTFAFAPAIADHCDNGVVIFFRAASGAPSVNADGGACFTTAAGVEVADLRYVPPGSAVLTVRYVGDVGVDTLSATVNGVATTLTINAARSSYNSPELAYGGGDVTAVVTLPGGATTSTTYTAI